jgi:hypothetical protein
MTYELSCFPDPDHVFPVVLYARLLLAEVAFTIMLNLYHYMYLSSPYYMDNIAKNIPLWKL